MLMVCVCVCVGGGGGTGSLVGDLYNKDSRIWVHWGAHIDDPASVILKAMITWLITVVSSFGFRERC